MNLDSHNHDPPLAVNLRWSPEVGDGSPVFRMFQFETSENNSICSFDRRSFSTNILPSKKE